MTGKGHRMKKSGIIKTIFVIAALIVAGSILLNTRYHILAIYFPKANANTKELYYCPMHPTYTSDKPGNCPICGMTLVKKETNKSAAGKDPTSKGDTSKILYYRSPMNPKMTSPVPMKDEMGMDYVPVFEKQESQKESLGVYISPQKQQLIGIKTAKVEKHKLFGQINTVGLVAYDPDLFVAQEEFLDAIKSTRGISDSNFAYVREQNDAFIKTSKRKLLLMGMSEDEIIKLIKAGIPDQNLYLPEDEKVWVYMAIYQYESEFIKTGLPVEIETSAYASQTFKGEIVSISPILDILTISFKVRVLVENPENKLKLQTFVNAKIKYDLGEKLAVPEDAIMDSGLHKYVFIAKPDGYFEPRDVKLGAKVEGFYEVLQGLVEGDLVTVSANFLIDSESKLNTVVTQMGEPNQPVPQ
jgi:Cu(I)/Ag(I) efflux system membrane fusion protein